MVPGLQFANRTVLAETVHPVVLDKHIGRKAIGHGNHIGIVEAILPRSGFQFAIPVRPAAASVPGIRGTVAAVPFKTLLVTVAKMPFAHDRCRVTGGL